MGSKQKSSEILLIGNELSGNDRLRRELLARACQVATVPRGDEGLERAKTHQFDVVVSDVLAPGLSGLEILRRLISAKPRLPIILIDKDANVESAIEATKLGAFEYVIGPLKMLELVEHILRAASRRSQVLWALETGSVECARSLVGSSGAMQHLYKEIGLAAGSSVTVLIRGSTGTGKELVARAIHQHSTRANQAFVAVNCSAIPETLLENELFGHEAGAFTGARTRRLGRFEQANLGTLFLDEIGDLTLAMQVKLLRVLQERRIQRLGSNQEIALNVRVVVATHRDLETKIAAGEFREDLFYRLNGLTVRTPELCEHREDICELIKHFMRKWQIDQSLEPLSICREAIAFFESRMWPGNVRELEHAVYRAALLGRGQAIELAHAEAACRQKQRSCGRPGHFRPEPLTDLVERARSGKIKNLRATVMEQTERSLIERVLAFTQGNQAKMADLLGVTRTTVRQILRKLGLKNSQDRQDGPNTAAPKVGRIDTRDVIRGRCESSDRGSLGL